MNFFHLVFLIFLSDQEISYRQLTWEDFRGPIVKAAAAESTTQLRLDCEEVDGKYTFKITAWFLPYESFTCTDREDVLRHEQGHLDLCQIEALRCSNEISKYQRVAHKKKVEVIYNRYVSEMHKLQEVYDRDTHHSEYVLVQKKWEENIKKELNKLIRGI